MLNRPKVRKNFSAYFFSLTAALFLNASDGPGEGAAQEAALRRILCSNALEWEGLLPPLVSMEPLILNYARAKLSGVDLSRLGAKESELLELGKATLSWLVATKMVASKRSGPSSIYWLTDQGWKILRDWQASKGALSIVGPYDRPRWDPVVRTLWVGSAVVKRYQLPAQNQIAVIEEFQRQGWPERIDFPASLVRCKPEAVAKKLQNDTVRNLNRSQHSKLVKLQFGGDGTGAGVVWDVVLPSHPPAAFH